MAIVGHRLYPDTIVQEQVQDLSLALNILLSKKPFLFQLPDDKNMGSILMGHSSGANNALLLVLDLLKHQYNMPFHSFIGLSGPYCIQTQYNNEVYRGVQHLSPMKPVCEHTSDNFISYSPHLQLHKYLKQHPNQKSNIPKLLFVHGMQDSTVSFTVSANAARLLRSVGIRAQELYVDVNHLDTVLHFMFGGNTCERVLDWLEYGNEYSADVIIDVT